MFGGGESALGKLFDQVTAGLLSVDFESLSEHSSQSKQTTIGLGQTVEDFGSPS
jgi:hypothetical protein